MFAVFQYLYVVIGNRDVDSHTVSYELQSYRMESRLQVKGACFLIAISIHLIFLCSFYIEFYPFQILGCIDIKSQYVKFRRVESERVYIDYGFIVGDGHRHSTIDKVFCCEFHLFVVDTVEDHRLLHCKRSCVSHPFHSGVGS